MLQASRQGAVAAASEKAAAVQRCIEHRTPRPLTTEKNLDARGRLNVVKHLIQYLLCY